MFGSKLKITSGISKNDGSVLFALQTNVIYNSNSKHVI